jgi:hypothetical protein
MAGGAGIGLCCRILIYGEPTYDKFDAFVATADG